MRAMILAAGLGTRFKPWTEKHPKALAPVNGKSLLQRNVEYLQRSGITDLVVNVHHFADQLEEAITANRGWGSQIIISDERDEVLETGGGLLKAAALLGEEPFLVLNADVLTDMDIRAMIAAHEKYHPLATLATSQRNTSRYFLFDDVGDLCGWQNVVTGEIRIARETIKPSPAAFSGIHIIDPRIFPLMTQRGKFSMVDVYLSLAGSEVIKRFDHSGSNFIDVGKPDAVAEAERLF